MPLINIIQLQKSYGKLNVLKGIDLALNKGECVGLMGPNGSGKTTLIKSILGLLTPDTGTIEVNGKKIALNGNYRNIFGYMPQISHFPEQMTVLSLFELMRELRAKSTSYSSVKVDLELYEQFDIPSMHTKMLGNLSGGMRQKVSATLAFLFSPEILILDEPTAALDPVSNEQFKEKVRKVTEAGSLVLISSHITSELDEMVNRIIYMMNGVIYIDVSRSELQENYPELKLNKAIIEALNSQGELC